MQDYIVRELLDEYRSNAIGTSLRDPKQSNKHAKRLLLCLRKLRNSERGRTGISDLISDPNPHVQLWAAGHTLEWNPSLGIEALMRIRDGNGPGSFDAKWTLIEYEKGQFDWQKSDGKGRPEKAEQ